MVLNLKTYFFPLSLHEHYGLLKSHIWTIFHNRMKDQNSKFNFDIQCMKNNLKTTRNLLSLMYRWKLDAFKTKYVKNAVCICGCKISPCHILVCNSLKTFIPVLMQNSSENIFGLPELTYNFLVSLENSPIGHYL